MHIVAALEHFDDNDGKINFVRLLLYEKYGLNELVIFDIFELSIINGRQRLARVFARHAVNFSCPVEVSIHSDHDKIDFGKATTLEGKFRKIMDTWKWD